MTYTDRIGRLILLLFLGLSLSSCGYLGDPATCTSYILGYYTFDDITVTEKEYTSTTLGSFHRLCINVDPETWKSVCCVYDEDRSLYDEYCRRFNDTTYPEQLVYSYNDAPECESNYPTSNFNSITLTCLSDWDNLHPAGSSLDDITTYVTATIEPFISSGYVKHDYDPSKAHEFIMESFGYALYSICPWSYYTICKKMDSISEKDLCLIGSGAFVGSAAALTQICELYVPKREGGSPCTLRVTMTNTDGETFTADVEIQ